jgi:hypothetical protein
MWSSEVLIKGEDKMNQMRQYKSAFSNVQGGPKRRGSVGTG